MYVKM